MPKILINTVSREDCINRVEIAAGLQVNPTTGRKEEGTEDEKFYGGGGHRRKL
jgi:hypothetical protein